MAFCRREGLAVNVCELVFSPTKEELHCGNTLFLFACFLSFCLLSFWVVKRNERNRK